MPAAVGAVLAVRTDTDEDDPEFGVGIINGDTGAFRIGGLAAGTYELRVRIEGSDDVVVGDVVVLAGEDTVLPEPIVLEDGGPEQPQEP
jgi:cell shape-determining protein MreC